MKANKQYDNAGVDIIEQLINISIITKLLAHKLLSRTINAAEQCEPGKENQND